MDLTLTYLLNHSTNNSTMVSRLPLRQHGFGKSIHPTHRGLLERAVQGRGKRILLKLIIGQTNKFICKHAYFILVFIILPTLSLPKRWIYAHPMLPDGHVTSLYHPTPTRIFFGWLLCVK
jgi:hypothetical protein